MALSSYLPGDPATHEKLSGETTHLRPFLTYTSGLSGASRSAHSVDGGVALSDMRDLQVPFRTKLQANFVTGNFLISVNNGRKSNDAVFLSDGDKGKAHSGHIGDVVFEYRGARHDAALRHDLQRNCRGVDP